MKTADMILNDLELLVLLGWMEDERSQPQTVSLDIKIQFKEPPVACITDNLADTFCYEKLVNAIKSHVAAHEFRLVEHLAHEIYQFLKQQLKTAHISLRLNKKPNIAGLAGGVSFIYGDVGAK